MGDTVVYTRTRMPGSSTTANWLSGFSSPSRYLNNWLNVNILAHRVLLKMMDPIATMFEREFIPDEASGRPFEAALWKECFYVLLKLLSSEHLVIEEFSPQVYFRRLCHSLPLTCALETAGCVAPCWRYQGGRSRNLDTTVEFSRSTSR